MDRVIDAFNEDPYYSDDDKKKKKKNRFPPWAIGLTVSVCVLLLLIIFFAIFRTKGGGRK